MSETKTSASRTFESWKERCVDCGTVADDLLRMVKPFTHGTDWDCVGDRAPAKIRITITVEDVDTPTPKD